MQALHLQHRSPSSYRVKARASYVDESLFGSPTGTRPSPPDFDPPWVQNCHRSRGVGPGPPKVSLVKRDCEPTPSRGSTPSLTPRKKNKYRLIGHTPSYCDESLFGSRPQGLSKEGSRTAMGDAAKLRTLFWTPPATPRGSYSPRPRETPLRAIHPDGPSRTEPSMTTGSQKTPQEGLDAPHSLGQRRSHSLTHLSVPSMGHPAAGTPQTNGPWSSRPSTSRMTARSPLVTPKARSGSVSGPAAPQRGASSPKPKPPWK
ncbi:RBPJ-interacting and tubulin-associated protein 1 [Mesocricetus auratus]|uniref:RBPJ-interacting and tubulin-associated protein 1 n=1 Tax=Mesocricetus auratus TaxID=10036 RepID=A0A1U7QR22_MESAU|nr:RBPJ-interacting and tubulin-associated protein 1 [Mesocricetus auratus]XP_040587046.1 RBPJ-interacting and tubulin-associated protein 1 [Mesocricetus auratus]XP_040587047.1 RBPJ-interacting and tubulin-associated protein 1 [Mesocricetus auratus]